MLLWGPEVLDPNWLGLAVAVWQMPVVMHLLVEVLFTSSVRLLPNGRGVLKEVLEGWDDSKLEWETVFALDAPVCKPPTDIVEFEGMIVVAAWWLIIGMEFELAWLLSWISIVASACNPIQLWVLTDWVKPEVNMLMDISALANHLTTIAPHLIKTITSVQRKPIFAHT